jgi:hypothetical protein
VSAIASVTWWNFYFRLFPGVIRSPQSIQHLLHQLKFWLTVVGELRNRLHHWNGCRNLPSR